MDRHTSEMLHDESMHEAVVRFAFLAGIVTAILILHRFFYHAAF